MISKLLQQSPVLPIAAFHTSIILAIVFLTFRDLDPNSMVGIRTPRTMNDPQQWRLVHDRAYRVMPWLSAICAALAVTAFWLPAMRTPLAALILVAIQLIVLFACALL